MTKLKLVSIETHSYGKDSLTDTQLKVEYSSDEGLLVHQKLADNLWVIEGLLNKILEHSSEINEVKIRFYSSEDETLKNKK